MLRFRNLLINEKVQFIFVYLILVEVLVYDQVAGQRFRLMIQNISYFPGEQASETVDVIGDESTPTSSYFVIQIAKKYYSRRKSYNFDDEDEVDTYETKPYNYMELMSADETNETVLDFYKRVDDNDDNDDLKLTSPLFTDIVGVYPGYMEGKIQIFTGLSFSEDFELTDTVPFVLKGAAINAPQNQVFCNTDMDRSENESGPKRNCFTIRSAIMCQKYFYSTNCSRLCIPYRNFVCSSLGEFMCSSNYYGDNCDKHCENSSDFVNGSHNCFPAADTCEKGFVGVNCTITCASVCKNQTNLSNLEELNRLCDCNGNNRTEEHMALAKAKHNTPKHQSSAFFIGFMALFLTAVLMTVGLGIACSPRIRSINVQWK